MDYNNKYIKYKLKYLKLKKNYKLIGGNNKNDLYLFKAEWCGHCQAFKNEWENLKKDNELNKKVNFITFDSEKDAIKIKEWKINGYPTILLKKNDATAVEYFGNRNINSIKEFINKNI